MDKVGKARTVGAIAGLAQERLEVLADNAMEDRALGAPRLIRRNAHGDG